MGAPFGSPAVIAHRGASAYAPEHSFAAYDLALAQGADALELDVRPLADGSHAVCHDATLARTCGDPRRVADVAPAALEDLDPDTRPPTLHAVLQRYAGRTRFLVELKTPAPADLMTVRDAITRAGVTADAVVQSFDHGALRTLHGLDPRVALCALFPKAAPRRLVMAATPRLATWACAMAVPVAAIDAAIVARGKGRGLDVLAYTVNDAAEIRRLLALGLDGVITDAPDLAQAARTQPLAA